MRNERGWTLLELLVVLAVLGLVLGLLAGQFDARPARQDELEAQRIEGLIIAAGQSAQRDGRERWLQTDAPDRLVVQGGDGTTASLDLRRARWRGWQPADAVAPRLRLHGDGSVTPGELRFEFATQERVLRIDWHGALRWRDARP